MQSIVTCLQEAHHVPTLILAAVICFVGVYGSFSIAQQAGRSDGVARKKWAAVSIMTAGCTAWATHMVALLAFQPGVQSGFEPFLTAFSLIIAVLGIGTGMFMTVGRRGRMRRFTSTSRKPKAVGTE